MPKHPQTSNKAGKRLRARNAAALLAAQSHRAFRIAAASLSESSNRRLNCSLTDGLIPQVCDQKSQSFLERQVVGLAPFPQLVGPDSCKHCKCGQPQGVAHVAFKCPELIIQRQSLISALDAERADTARDSAWGNLTDAQKLAQSFCPSRVGTLSVPATCTFYSASAKARSRFYDEAEEALGGTA